MPYTYMNWNFLNNPISTGDIVPDDFPNYQNTPLRNLTIRTNQMMYLGQGGLNFLQNAKACADSTPFEVLSNNNQVTTLDARTISNTTESDEGLRDLLVSTLYSSNTSDEEESDEDNKQDKLRQNQSVQNFLNQYNHNVVFNGIIALFNKNILVPSYGSAILDTSNLKQNVKIKINKAGNIVVEATVTELQIKQIDVNGQCHSHPIIGSFTFATVLKDNQSLVSVQSNNPGLIKLFEGRLTVDTLQDVCPNINIPDKENVANNFKILSHRLAGNDGVLNHSSLRLLEIIFPEINTSLRMATLNDFLQAFSQAYTDKSDFNSVQITVIDFLYSYTQNQTEDFNQRLFKATLPKKINEHYFFDGTQCQYLRMLLGLPPFAPKTLEITSATMKVKPNPKTNDNLCTVLSAALSRNSMLTHPHEKELTQHIINFVTSKQTPDDEQTLIKHLEDIFNQNIPELNESVKNLLPISSTIFFEHILNTATTTYSWDHIKSKLSHFFASFINDIIDAATFPFSWDRIKIKFSNFINFFRKDGKISYVQDYALTRPHPILDATVKPKRLTREDITLTEIRRFRLSTPEKCKDYILAYNAEQTALYREHQASYLEQTAVTAEALAAEAASKAGNVFYYIFLPDKDHLALLDKASELRTIATEIREKENGSRAKATSARQQATDLAKKAGLSPSSQQAKDMRDLYTADDVFNDHYITQEVQAIQRTVDGLFKYQDGISKLNFIPSPKELFSLIEQGNKFIILEYLEMQAFIAERTALLPKASECNKNKASQLRLLANQFKNSELFIETLVSAADTTRTTLTSDVHNTETSLSQEVLQTEFVGHSAVTLPNNVSAHNVYFPAVNNIQSHYKDTPENHQIPDSLKIIISQLNDGILKAREEINIIKDQIDKSVNNNADISQLSKEKNDLIVSHSTELFAQAQAGSINITKFQLILLINCHTSNTVEDYMIKNDLGTNTYKPIIKQGNSVMPAQPLVTDSRAVTDNADNESIQLLQN